jgi:uncharacterized membrane protein YedE/YeeE
MMRRVTEFLVGLLFGAGLLLSGMTDPGKVIGFLDPGGLWDPSLAFVMGGAVVVGFFGFRFARTLKSSLFGRAIVLSDGKRIDGALLAGSALFGIGWGLSGFCPGPAIVSLGIGEPKAFVFVLAMLLGMVAQARWSARRGLPQD